MPRAAASLRAGDWRRPVAHSVLFPPVTQDIARILPRNSRARSNSQFAHAAASIDPTCEVHFVAANVTVTACAGQIIYDVADKCGIETITVGCCSGSCGVCEVEVKKYSRERSSDSTAPGIVVRSCVTPLPPGYPYIQINELVDDVWGLDGYDT
jgi:ferredoxin